MGSSVAASIGNGISNPQNKSPLQQNAPFQQYPRESEVGEPIRLYCLCRTADESASMIGCDKCEEWYHFECVGIDPT